MRIEKLCEKLNYTFQDKGLLRQALSHRSMGEQSNERLEFLGDAVLNFTVAAELFKRYPQAKEGELSRLRASLVNGTVLADLAREMQLGEYLYLGVGERKSGGSVRSSILADTMEAVIGAIYLDSGIDVCGKLILQWLEKNFTNIINLELRDPKTRLQELLQGRKMALPVYVVTAVTGEAHSQVFHVECKVEGIAHSTLGVGPSKRKAEQNAAEIFLHDLDVV